MTDPRHTSGPTVSAPGVLTYASSVPASVARPMPAPRLNSAARPHRPLEVLPTSNSPYIGGLAIPSTLSPVDGLAFPSS